MRQKIIILLACVTWLINVNVCLGQDAASVLFETGSAKMEERQIRTLNNIVRRYNLTELSKVEINGFADSTGKRKTNLRLSEKRAKNVADFLQSYIPEGTPLFINAQGEKDKHIEAFDRRVEIVFYFNEPDPELVQQKQATEEERAGCHYINYDMLHFANTRTVIRNKKEHILIEIQNDKPAIQHYYAVEDDTGGFVPVKLSWKPKRTGKKWSAGTRYVAIVPKQSFEKYKIFTIRPVPCARCNEAFGSNKKAVKITQCLRPDFFLMSRVQAKPVFLNRKEVKIRVPAENVDLNTTYYAGATTNAMEWEIKEKKKHKDHLFSRLPVYHNNAFDYSISGIYRFMICCNEKRNDTLYAICGGTSGGGCPPYYIGIEAGGMDYSNLNAYAGLGIYREWKHGQANITAGASGKNFYAVARYQYNFISIPLSIINPAPVWRSPYDMFNNRLFLRAYIGTQWQKGNSAENYHTLQQDVHAGISIAKIDECRFFKRAFLQYGAAYDYFDHHNKDIAPVLQFGVIFSLRKMGSDWEYRKLKTPRLL